MIYFQMARTSDFKSKIAKLGGVLIESDDDSERFNCANPTVTYSRKKTLLIQWKAEGVTNLKGRLQLQRPSMIAELSKPRIDQKRPQEDGLREEEKIEEARIDIIKIAQSWKPIKKQKITPFGNANGSANLIDPIEARPAQIKDPILPSSANLATPTHHQGNTEHDCNLLKVYMPNGKYDHSIDDPNINYWAQNSVAIDNQQNGGNAEDLKLL